MVKIITHECYVCGTVVSKYTVIGNNFVEYLAWKPHSTTENGIKCSNCIEHEKARIKRAQFKSLIH